MVEIAEIWKWLEAVPDPEIPVLSVVDLGIVREVEWQGGELVVTVTPTYSGCPATELIRHDIAQALRDHGLGDIRLQTRLSPPWTTDWLSPQGRERLREFGIAPPGPAAAALVQITGPAACPHCGARDAERISQFGSTPCKALYRCRACREPFDYFKPI